MWFILDRKSENQIIPTLWATAYFWDGPQIAAMRLCGALMQNGGRTTFQPCVVCDSTRAGLFCGRDVFTTYQLIKGMTTDRAIDFIDWLICGFSIQLHSYPRRLTFRNISYEYCVHVYVHLQTQRWGGNFHFSFIYFFLHRRCTFHADHFTSPPTTPTPRSCWAVFEQCLPKGLIFYSLCPSVL